MVEGTRSLRSAMLSEHRARPQPPSARHANAPGRIQDRAALGRKTFFTPTGKAQLADTHNALLAYEAIAKDMAATLRSEPLPELTGSTRQLFTVGTPTANKLTELMTTTGGAQSANAKALSEETDVIYANIRTLLIGLTLGGVLAGVADRDADHPQPDAPARRRACRCGRTLANAIAAGDLSTTIDDSQARPRQRGACDAPDASLAAPDRQHRARQQRQHCHRRAANCHRQQRPVQRTETPGQQPGANRRVDGRDDQHRAAPAPTPPARPRSWPPAPAMPPPRAARWWSRWSHTMQEINDSLAQDRRHHWRDRRHRLPDQHPGAERRRGSRPRGRTRPGLCRGGQRGAQPGRAQRRGRQRNQGADPATAWTRWTRAASWSTTQAAPCSDIVHEVQRVSEPDPRDQRLHQRADRGHRPGQRRPWPSSTRSRSKTPRWSKNRAAAAASLNQQAQQLVQAVAVFQLGRHEVQARSTPRAPAPRRQCAPTPRRPNRPWPAAPPAHALPQRARHPRWRANPRPPHRRQRPPPRIAAAQSSKNDDDWELLTQAAPPTAPTANRRCQRALRPPCRRRGESAQTHSCACCSGRSGQTGQCRSAGRSRSGRSSGPPGARSPGTRSWPGAPGPRRSPALCAAPGRAAPRLVFAAPGSGSGPGWRSAHQHRHANAHHVARIAAVAGQVRHQFHEEGEQRKEDEAPDKRPVGAVALLDKQPARPAPAAAR